MRVDLALKGLGMLAFAVMVACRSAPKRDAKAPPPVSLGHAADAFGVRGTVAELLGGLPATVLVGGGEDLDSLLDARRALAGAPGGATLALLVDVSALGPVERATTRDRLVEAALEPGGPVLIDERGGAVGDLADGPPLVVRLDARGAAIDTAFAEDLDAARALLEGQD